MHGPASEIPTISDDLWHYLLKSDFDRMAKENGPVAFVEHNYPYKNATEILPIDRIIETYFRSQGITNFPGVPAINSHGNDPATLRIRGGGDTDELDEQPNISSPLVTLSSLPLEDMHNLAVFGMIQQRQQSGGNVFYVGRAAVMSNEEPSPLVVIEIFYIQGTGMLKEVRHLREWNRENTFLVPGANMADTENAVIAKMMVYNRKKARIVMRNRTEKVAQLLTKKLRGVFSSLLGTLPDGRMVYWFHSDPHSLYLFQNGSMTDLDFKLTSVNALGAFEKIAERGQTPFVDVRDRTAFFCPWGCCMKVTPSEASDDQKGKKILSFGTLEELHEHFCKYHNYGNSRRQVDQSNCWTRVSEGVAIKDLCADLASHICSRSDTAQQFALQYQRCDEEYEEFIRSPMGHSITLNLSKLLRNFI